MRNDQWSLSVEPEATLDEVTDPDIVLIGGGPGFSGQLGDGKLHEWLRSVDRTSTWTTSVCTGAPILAAARLLQGRRATTHWSAFGELERFGAIPAHERVVFDGHYVTGAGVSAGITGEVRRRCRSASPGRPPTRSGSTSHPRRSEERLVEVARAKV